MSETATEANDTPDPAENTESAVEDAARDAAESVEAAAEEASETVAEAEAVASEAVEAVADEVAEAAADAVQAHPDLDDDAIGRVADRVLQRLRDSGHVAADELASDTVPPPEDELAEAVEEGSVLPPVEEHHTPDTAPESEHAWYRPRRIFGFNI